MVFSSISNYLSGLSHFLKSNGQPGVDYSDFKIKQILRGARRTCPKGRGQAKAILPDDLMKMYLCIDILSIDDLVFWGAVALAFRALLRASNICGRIHGVKIVDLIFVGEDLHVMVKTSKTNQFAEYLSKIVIVKSDSVLCPIYWIKELIRLSNPTPSDYLFRRLVRGRWRRMSYTWFNTKLASITTTAGLGAGYSTHSLRRGGPRI